MTELDGLRLERNGDVATITLDVPEKLNRVSMPARDQLAQLFEQLGADAGVRAISSRSFSKSSATTRALARSS